MRRFLASGWFPIVTALLLAAATAGAYAWMKPTGVDIGNSEIQKYAIITGWAIGPVIGFLTLIVAGLLNLIRRIVRARRVGVLHPIIVLIPVGFWLVLGWQLAGEPRFTPIAKAVIDFAARPMIVGSFAAAMFVVALWLIAGLTKKSA